MIRVRFVVRKCENLGSTDRVLDWDVIDTLSGDAVVAVYSTRREARVAARLFNRDTESS